MRVRKILHGGAVALFGVLAVTIVRADPADPHCPDTLHTAAQGDAQQFDFLLGSWTVRNHRLKQRLANSREWIDFAAADRFAKLPGGLGIDEHYTTSHWPGYAALGLHLYDPRHKLWTLYWADNRNAPGTMQTLAKGTFMDGVGVFCAPDTFAGRPITVRILWKRVDVDHVRWEQAFSTDHGTRWETNWIMDFTRASARKTY